MRVQLLSLLVFVCHILSLTAATTTGECKPATWSKSSIQGSKPTPDVMRIKNKKSSVSVANLGEAKPGEINCRYPGGTSANVDSDTCAQLVKKYQMSSLEVFFMLNPDVDSDCGNIEPYTDYCVHGCKAKNPGRLVEERLMDWAEQLLNPSELGTVAAVLPTMEQHVSVWTWASAAMRRLGLVAKNCELSSCTDTHGFLT
jgi:hypothetical protein